MSSVGKGKIDELLSYVIFESTVSIFSIGLPGADILIPAYLVEISAMVCFSHFKHFNLSNTRLRDTRVHSRQSHFFIHFISLLTYR